MNHTMLCAICGDPVAMDTDHVKIDAETRRMQDRNDLDEYYLHIECAMNSLDTWRDPA